MSTAPQSTHSFRYSLLDSTRAWEDFQKASLSQNVNSITLSIFCSLSANWAIHGRNKNKLKNCRRAFPRRNNNQWLLHRNAIKKVYVVVLLSLSSAAPSASTSMDKETRSSRMRNAFRFFSIQWLWHSIYMECFREFQWRVKEELAWFFRIKAAEQNEFSICECFESYGMPKMDSLWGMTGLDWKATRRIVRSVRKSRRLSGIPWRTRQSDVCSGILPGLPILESPSAGSRWRNLLYPIWKFKWVCSRKHTASGALCE